MMMTFARVRFRLDLTRQLSGQPCQPEVHVLYSPTPLLHSPGAMSKSRQSSVIANSAYLLQTTKYDDSFDKTHNTHPTSSCNEDKKSLSISIS